MKNLEIRKKKRTDNIWIKKILVREWNSTNIICFDKKYKADLLPAFLALKKDKLVGLLTYTFENQKSYIISLNSLIERKGIGSALLNEVLKKASEKNLRSILVSTTNDNIGALIFYQKKGFKISKINIGIMKKYRKLKVEIPEKGYFDIEIRDEIILKKELGT